MVSGKRVAILSGRSLFLDAITRRLSREYPDRFELHPIDVRVNNPVECLALARPDVILLDVNDPELRAIWTLDRIVQTLPHVRVIMLDSQHEPVRVLDADQARVQNVSDLAEIIQPLGLQFQITS